MKYLQVDALSLLTGRLQECRIGQRIIQGRIEAYTMKRAGNDKKYAADLGSKYVEQQESFEKDWKQLVDANNLRHKADSEESQRIQQQQQHKRGRSQSVGICQDLSKQPSHRAKHARSSSFDEVVLKPSPLPHFDVPRQLTPLGDLRDLSTRRLMTDLILTLNSSFPDYDFSSVQAHDFQQVALQDVTQAVYSQLSPFLCNTNETDVVSNGVTLVGPGSIREDGTQQTQTLLIVDLWNALDELMNLKECVIYSWSNADMASEELWLWSFHYFFVNKALKRIVFFTCSECMNGRLPIEDDDDADGIEETEQMMPAGRLADAESEDANFDLDPSAAQAGGFSLFVV